jgi:hypothetical protein
LIGFDLKEIIESIIAMLLMAAPPIYLFRALLLWKSTAAVLLNAALLLFRFLQLSKLRL